MTSAASASPSIARAPLVEAVAGALYALTLPLVWGGRRRVARKLAGFAATEAGSSLDMLKAAELVSDAGLRRLFFRHALDEARHARLFADQAARLGAPPAGRPRSDYDGARAARQDLFARLGLVRFVAFVYLAELRGELQFRALEGFFRRRGRFELADLFARIRRDERFHVRYSEDLLRRFRAEGQAAAVRRALARTRLGRAAAAWRGAGRIVGDVVGRAVLGAVYLVLLAPFALLTRLLDPGRTGWSPPRRAPRPDDSDALAAARRQA
jgi:hypothetical protein